MPDNNESNQINKKQDKAASDEAVLSVKEEIEVPTSESIKQNTKESEDKPQPVKKKKKTSGEKKKKGKKKKKKKKGKKKKEPLNLKWLVILFALVLFYGGVLLISLPFLKSTYLNYKTVDFEYVVNNELPNVIKKTEEIHPPTVKEAMETEKPAPESVIGQLSIASVDMNIPVFAGITNQNLLFGAVSMYVDRDPLIDNIVILGHHLGYSGKLFSSLLDVKRKDIISIRYLGVDYEYEVSEVGMIPETDLSVLETTKDDKGVITLITCDQANETENRYIVKGRLIEEENSKAQSENEAKNQSTIKTITKQNFTYKDALPLILTLAAIILGTGIIIRLIK